MLKPSQHQIIIVGGGQAGAMVAKNLLASGCEGGITLICGEPHLPYERPPLSKSVLASKEAAASSILPPGICGPDAPPGQLEIRLGQKVISLDRQRKTVTLANAQSLSYRKLVIATGGTPRKLHVEQGVKTGIHYLRTIGDAASLRDALSESNHVLIIGGGWIGLETAATARTLGKTVTLLEADSRLCSRSLPAPTAEFLADYHRRQGVDLRFETRVERFGTDSKGAITHAFLTDGSCVATDIAVVGIGLEPDTTLAQSAGLKVGSGILVDSEGRTSDPDIYAAGDAAECECRWHGRLTRIESWHNANLQAGIVAASIMRQALPPPEPPWFWSDQFGLNIQILGVPKLADAWAQHIHGPESSLSVYWRNDEICGAIAINRARDLKLIGRAMKGSGRIELSELVGTGSKRVLSSGV